MKQLLFQFQHVKVHEASVLVLFFAGELNETHRLVESYSRNVGINSKETKCTITVVLIQQNLDRIDQLTTQMLAMIVFRYCKPAYFYTRVAAKLFAGGKAFADFLPVAVCYILSANPVIQQTAIRNNPPLILNDKSLCHSFLNGAFSILDKKSVQIIITTIKSGNGIVLCKTKKSHVLQTDFYPFAKCFVVFTNSTTVLCALFLAHVLYFKTAHLKVESVNALQDWCLFNWPCHNSFPF